MDTMITWYDNKDIKFQRWEIKYLHAFYFSIVVNLYKKIGNYYFYLKRRNELKEHLI